MSNWLDIRSMPPRSKDEHHRPATPLELLFDLVSVIAIAAAAAGLHHAIAADHAIDGLIHFAAAFFMIWWAWMNYTWFASAYDNDDTVFRLLTMLCMAGSLTIAAGIPRFFEHADLDLVLLGFIIMRIGMISLWLRAAWHDTDNRKTALYYAVGIALVQVYWVVMILNQPSAQSAFLAFFSLGVLLELSVPVVAERQQATPWHRHHMIERYGLLNIIVLGETLLASTMAMQHVSSEHFDIQMIAIAMLGLVIMFSLWWLYFSREDHLQDDNRQLAFIWGYGHILIYAGGAAVGAGIAVQVDIASHHAAIGAQAGVWAVSLPVALYVCGLWLVRDRFLLEVRKRWCLPVMALLIALTPLAFGLETVALLLLITVWWRNKHAALAHT